jgi:hypothetical protein
MGEGAYHPPSTEKKMKYVAWYNGQLLPDVILGNILAAAERGLMTEAGSKLLLVPDRRYGRPDETGLKTMKSVKKWECVTLAEKYPKAFQKLTFN